MFPLASYQRLREIKARYDPDQVIISTHPVRNAHRQLNKVRARSTMRSGRSSGIQ